MLEGMILPSRIAEKLDIHVDLVRQVQDSTEFIRLYQGAKDDASASAIERARTRAHTYMARMEALSVCLDPGVRRAALTDLLNRAGTGHTAKVELGVSAYRKIVERYVDTGESDDG